MRNDYSGFPWALDIVYKKLGQFFMHTYSLTCLNKDTSVLLRVIKQWSLNFLKNSMHMWTIPLIKL